MSNVIEINPNVEEMFKHLGYIWSDIKNYIDIGNFV